MQLKIRIVDAKFLQFTYEGHILVLVPTGGDLLVSVSTNSFHPRLLALIIWFPFIISTGLHHAGPGLLLLISCHFCKEPLLLQLHFRETFWLNYKWINTEDCTGMQFAILERKFFFVTKKRNVTVVNQILSCVIE